MSVALCSFPGVRTIIYTLPQCCTGHRRRQPSVLRGGRLTSALPSRGLLMKRGTEGQAQPNAPLTTSPWSFRVSC